jgi:hypothetical protein
MLHIGNKYERLWKELGLELDAYGQAHAGSGNLRIILEKTAVVQWPFWYDKSRNCVLTGNTKNSVRPWSSADTLHLAIRIQSEFGLAHPPGLSFESVINLQACTQSAPIFLIEDMEDGI